MRRVWAVSATLCLLTAVGEGQNVHWADPTTLYVVLIRFPDHDPHGYTRTEDEDGTVSLRPGASSYKMVDFERFFGVDGAADFEGRDVRVANGPDGWETLPEVFGSLRAYFHEISGGNFRLNVRILNPRAGEYPEWLEVHRTRAHYNEDTKRAIFYDARMALTGMNGDGGAMQRWYGAAAADFDLPTGTSSNRNSTRIAYIYAGRTFTNDMGLHPRADRGEMGGAIYYQYLMGEREGEGAAEGFSAIGLHVHEFGHLLGFLHPNGYSRERNPYADQKPCETTFSTPSTPAVRVTKWRQAALAGWGSMQGGQHGPAQEPRQVDDNRAYVTPYKSCPNPYNGAYMEELGWSTETITEVGRHRINPGTYYVIQGDDGSKFILEFRTAEGFGQFTHWYRFDQAPGLLVWKRLAGRRVPRLIPADDRLIFNALPQTQVCTENAPGQIRGYSPRFWNSSHIYPWIDSVSDPFGALVGTSTVEMNGLRTTIRSMAAYQGEAGQALAAALPPHLALAGDAHRAIPDWATDDSHFRYNQLRPEPPPQVGLKK